MKGETMSILLDKEHGVNPAMYNCFYCNETAGIILPGANTKAFREVGLADGSGKMNTNIGVMDMQPCPKCEGYMEQGVILVSCKNEDAGSDNPYRTGGWIVVRDEFIERNIKPKELSESIIKRRFCFVPDEAWDLMGFPRGEA
jgi:hypothetical protein